MNDEQINDPTIINVEENLELPNNIQKLTFKKPLNWNKLMMYEKIKYYASILDGEYAPYVDKLEVKERVKQLMNNSKYEVKTAKLIRVLKNCDDLQPEDLNPKWIIKATHGCAWNINLNDEMCKSSNINKTLEICKNKLKSWNKHYITPNEKHYTYLTPRFFIEEKVIEKDGKITGEAPNYMIRCIHGIPYTIGYKRNNKQNSYDINWNPTMKGELPNIPKPENLDQLIEISKILSNPFEFVRIDLYDCLDGIYLNEFTFTPGGGGRVFPIDIEKYYGDFWT